MVSFYEKQGNRQTRLRIPVVLVRIRKESEVTDNDNAFDIRMTRQNHEDESFQSMEVPMNISDVECERQSKRSALLLDSTLEPVLAPGPDVRWA